ncbi:hypothetical protein DPMN_082438 [Dreissena polymorpha]|uniref:Uncharacterized protein n=1 Tax=Dreissena polymorpha TaxID=45954 RepID=A0A9D3YA21_DREPO|nr:hypothetical protein DPMN_082438 [Dreissena polymorpha]
MEDFHTLPAIIADIQKKLETAKDDTQEFRKELKDSYDKAYKEIKVLRQKINDILDELERKTILSLDNLLQTLNQSIQSDADTCSKTTDGLKKICNTINDIENIPNDLSFIAYHKTLEIVSHAQNLFKELTGTRRPLVIFNKNPSIDTTLSELSSLGSIEFVEKNLKKDNAMIIDCTLFILGRPTYVQP